jgi:iron complex outermembrane receptor protein
LGASIPVLAALAAPIAAHAADTPVASSADRVATDDADKTDKQKSDLAEGSDIVVTATQPNELAPVTASLQATQPQSIVSRSFIEEALPATADFNQIALISPSVSTYGGTNGAGLSESKAQIRGFQDGEFNITYDGVPFGDTNDPTHHSNTFFPSNTIETLIVDRGPGNASQLGQATFGGNINLFSRAVRDDFGVQLKGSYGSWNTYLLRGLVQTGKIDSLGGTEAVFSAQHVATDGARTFSPYKANNVFGKILVPISDKVKLTILGTYNENRFNQPDKDGATLSQVALYGKNFSLNNDPTSQTYYGYNYTNKTTDFEIVKIEAELAKWLNFDTRAYTYSYDNETLSGNNVTLYATATPAAIAAANVVQLTQGGPKVYGIPGYTKTNKYRVYGDITKLHADLGFAGLTLGGWYETSDTYRQQRDVNLLTGDRNFAESNVTNPVTGALTPSDIKFDQNSSIDHYEFFGEAELRPFDGLKITPGIKYVHFTRQIDAAYNQTTRYAQDVQNTYSSTLPFVTVNYQANDQVSVYGQFAKGFLMPSLSVLYVANPGLSTVAAEKSTNYQAGVVYHGSHLSIDADFYYIDFANKFASYVSPLPGVGTVFINQGAVIYQGVEGQVTYAIGNGIAFFANGSSNYAKTNNPGSPHTQVPNAPKSTVAGGVLYRKGPIAFSLIDKLIGPQYAIDGEVPAYRIAPYNDAILSVRYKFKMLEFGLEIDDLFGSTQVTNINQGKTAPFDQYFYQPGRSVTGDITVRF